MQNSNLAEFDFDKWRKLAQDNPEKFESARRDAINSLITDAPTSMQDRLQALQWRIDMERKRSKDPLVSCQRVFNMMWDSVYGDNGLLNALEDLTGSVSGQTQVIDKSDKSSATILSFKTQNAGAVK